MQSIAELETNAIRYPNSIEVNQALAEAYARDERWQDSVKIYQKVVELYPAIAALNVNRIRLGAIALGISSFLFLVSQILRPPSFLHHPYDIVDFLPASSISNILFLPVLILLSCAAISIYKLLSVSNSNRPAFWGMVLIVVGAGMYLPLFGLTAVILPAAGDLYAQGETAGFDVYYTLFQQPLASVFTFGGYLLFGGLTIFTVVIWIGGHLYKLASTMLWLGWSLFIVGDELFLILGYDLLWWWSFNFLPVALLVTIGGIALALDMWHEALLQFTPDE
jgi:hypothetical protein